MDLTKITATLNSRNFFVSLISIILLAFAANDLAITADPGEILDTVTSNDVGRIVSLFFLNFLNPLTKLLSKSASWSWSFLKSPNFWTQTVTTILVGLSMFGLQFPDGAAAGIIDAVFSGEFNAISVALVINIINPLYHFIFDRKEKPEKDPALG